MPDSFSMSCIIQKQPFPTNWWGDHLFLLLKTDFAISWLAVETVDVLKPTAGDLRSWVAGDAISWLELRRISSHHCKWFCLVVNLSSELGLKCNLNWHVCEGFCLDSVCTSGGQSPGSGWGLVQRSMVEVRLRCVAQLWLKVHHWQHGVHHTR